MAAATNKTTAGKAATTPANPPPTTTISPIKKTKSTSSSNKSPSKQSNTKSSENAKSSTSKKSPTTKKSSSSTTSSAAIEKQLKIQKAEIAKRELKELEAMERAFRQDMEVWNGPGNVVFPRRYHSIVQLRHNGGSGGGTGSSSVGGNNGKSKKRGEKDTSKGNATTNSNAVYYGSQSQGWMYGDGLARMGGLSWMDVTTPPVSASQGNSKRKKSDASSTTKQQQSSSGFLVDDVSIIDKSLSAAGLTRSHLTPRAYACLLEQARRYTLELLADAQDYALHANRDSIAALLPSDVLLAVEMREDTNGVSSTLPRVEDVQCVAEEVNRVPLPAIPRDCYGGVVLPPVEEQLTARTFDVVNGVRVVQRMMRGGDYPMGLSDVGSLSKKGGGGGGGGGGRKTGSYGAAMGRQISVNLKSGGSKGGEDKSKGGDAASTPTASKASSGSKGQKRRLTEL